MSSARQRARDNANVRCGSSYDGFMSGGRHGPSGCASSVMQARSRGFPQLSVHPRHEDLAPPTTRMENTVEVGRDLDDTMARPSGRGRDGRASGRILVALPSA
jgi:hypothetical protein